MQVLFVRHGETEGNRLHRHQTADTPLNDRGRQQAAAVAARVADFNPTHLLVSPYARTRQTADIINETLNLPIVENRLFREIVRAERIRGKHYSHPSSVFYMARWFLERRSLRDSETLGESHRAFLNRIHKAKEHLQSYPDDARVVVISHSAFINFFIEHICNETPISPWKGFLMLAKIKRLDNSSLTEAVYNPSYAEGVCKWSVLRYDDDAHVVT